MKKIEMEVRGLGIALLSVREILKSKPMKYLLNFKIHMEGGVILKFSSWFRNDLKDISSCTHLGGVSNVSF